MKLSPRQRRIALLLGQGYGLNEVARRMGITPGAVSAMTFFLSRKVCSEDQRDGRSSSRIVTVWAARNLEAIHSLIQSERAAQWRELPDVVTEARIGIA